MQTIPPDAEEKNLLPHHFMGVLGPEKVDKNLAEENEARKEESLKAEYGPHVDKMGR